MKRFWIVLLLVAVIGAAIGFIIWNKPHPKAEDQKGIEVTATGLYTEFKTNEAAANKKYLNQVLDVSGKLIDQEKNQDGQTVAILQGDTSDDLLAGAVMCTFRDKNVTIPKEGTLKIKGFCNGIANDVHLSDCVLNEQSDHK